MPRPEPLRMPNIDLRKKKDLAKTQRESQGDRSKQGVCGIMEAREGSWSLNPYTLLYNEWLYFSNKIKVKSTEPISTSL